MDTEKSDFFSKREEEIAEMLSEAGLRRNYARVLVSLFKDTRLTSRDIERGTDLRQPEVSIAINYLIKKGWARVAALITENKGRPVKIYELANSIDTILDEIEEEKRGEYSTQIELIERVRILIKESVHSVQS